jgi:hypothetical protein
MTHIRRYLRQDQAATVNTPAPTAARRKA